MYYTNSRELKIMYLLLDSSVEAPISSTELSKYCHCSVRTIKYDIQELNDRLKEEKIIKIEASTGKGYYLNVLDVVSYQTIKGELLQITPNYNYNDFNEINIELYCIQTLLAENSITLDELGSRVSYSRYSIQKLMKQIKTFFSSYDIEIVSSASSGLSLKGNEKNIRDCMVESFCSQYYQFDNRYEVKKFSNMFYTNIEDYQDLRHALLKEIRESRISLKDIETKKLATYLVLMQNRINNNKTISPFPKEIANKIKESYEYKLSKKIFKNELIKAWVSVNDNEIVQFAAKLIQVEDYTLDRQSEYCSLQYDALNRSHEILTQLESDNSLPFLSSSFYEKDRWCILSIILDIVIKNDFHICQREQLVTYVENSSVEITPIANEYARLLVLKLQNVLGTTINNIYVINLAVIYEYILLKEKLEFKKFRLAIVSTNGLVIAKQMRDNLLSNYDNYIEYAHIFNLYELRGVDFSDYDIVLADIDLYINNYPLPFYIYRPYSIGFHHDNLLFEFMQFGFDSDSVDILIKQTHTFQGLSVKNSIDLFKYCASLYCPDNTDELIEQWTSEEEIDSFYESSTKSVILRCPYTYTNNEFINYYKLGKDSTWNRHKLDYLIVYSFDDNIPKSRIKLTSAIFSRIVKDSTRLRQIFQNMERTYFDIYSEVIKHEFDNNL